MKLVQFQCLSSEQSCLPYYVEFSNSFVFQLCCIITGTFFKRNNFIMFALFSFRKRDILVCFSQYLYSSSPAMRSLCTIYCENAHKIQSVAQVKRFPPFLTI